MSNIDNLGNKAANAGNGLVGITGTELNNLLRYIRSIAATGTGDVMADGSVPFTGQETFSAGLKTDTISPDGTSGVSFTSMIGLAKYTSAQEAVLVPADGFAYYNTDLDVIRTYNGSAWSNTAPSANPTFTGVVKIADGSAAAPSLTFTTDPNTGIILSAADSLGFVTNGVEKWVINSSGSLNPVLDNTYDIGSGLVNPRDIQASRTLIAGKASTTNGALTFQNSAGATTVTVSSPAAKQILIDNPTHDVIVGINGAAETGFGLKVTGNATVTGGFGSTGTVTTTGDTYDATPAVHTILADGAAAALDLTISVGTAVEGQIIFIKAIAVNNPVMVAAVDGQLYTFARIEDAIIVQVVDGVFRLMSEYKQ